MQPKIQYIQGSKYYFRVLETVRMILSNGEAVTIEKGFVFDLSSVPRILWALFPPYGDFLPAALLHDWMYYNRYGADRMGKSKARKWADCEMWVKSNKCNENWLDNTLRYYAVRMFGWWNYYRDNSKTREIFAQ